MGYIARMTDVETPAQASAPALDLRDASLYINRELSWLAFNRRVLHEALDPRTPALERLKFHAIFSGNLDEFYQVRVAGLKRQVSAGRSGNGSTPISMPTCSRCSRRSPWTRGIRSRTSPT